MLTTHLTQFLKNIFELLERKNVNLERSDENIMSHVVRFVMNVFKNAQTSVDSMQLSEAFRTSLAKDLHVICDDILNLIAHLNPEIELIDTRQDFEIYNSNKPVIGTCFTSDMFTNRLTQLDDYYWNSEDFVSFKVVQESDTRRTYFEKPLWSYQELEKIQHGVNNTINSKSQTTRNPSSSSTINVTKTTRKEKEKVVKTEETSLKNLTGALCVPDTGSQNLTSTSSKIMQDHSTPCTINPVSVRNVNTLNDLNAKSVNNTINSKSQTTRNPSSSSTINVTKTTSKEKEKVVKTEETSLKNLTGALCVPDTGSQNLTSTSSRIIQDHSTPCTINHVSVRNVNSLNDLNAKGGFEDTLFISILHLNNLAFINASFAVDKMAFNSIIVEGALYKCSLCSVYTELATDESLNSHIQSSSHMDKLAKDVIWISSLGICVKTVRFNTYKCGICSNADGIKGMNKHFKSTAHKHSFSSAAALCGSTLEAMENAMEDREMNAQTLTSDFQTFLNQHKIKLLENQLRCYTCTNSKIPMSLYNLYTHIAGQKHWRPYLLLLKTRFAKMPKMRNDADRTYRGFMKVYSSRNKSYCQICKIFIEGMSTKTMNSHIKGYAHNKFLMLFLKNTKASPYIDLNEVSQEEAGVLSLPGASHGKQKANTSKKTETFEPTFIHDAGSDIMFDYNIAINKYSWNGITESETGEFCVPCLQDVDMMDSSDHIEEDLHKTKLRGWPVNWEHLTRKLENGDSVFCLPCGALQETATPIHSLSINHKTRVEQLTLNFESWKSSVIRYYVRTTLPTFSDAQRDILTDIFKQNKLLVANGSYKVFCGLCSQEFHVKKLQEIYDHIARTGHFSAYVKSLDLNWTTFEPKYANGIIKSTKDKTICYCLVCNFILPSAEAAAHRTSSVHEYLLPIFIRTAFSDHSLKHTDDRVVCTMCKKKLCDKSLNMFNIYDHITGSLHVKNCEEVFNNINVENGEISLDLGRAGVQRLRQFDIAYCGTCNILFNDVSDASVFAHLDSKIHHIFEYVGPEKL